MAGLAAGLRWLHEPEQSDRLARFSFGPMNADSDAETALRAFQDVVRHP